MSRDVTTAPGARILAVVGAKGGVGTTTVAVHLAWRLAERGERVLLVDLAVDGPDVRTVLDLGDGPTLRDLAPVLDVLRPADVVATTSCPRSGLRVLDGASDPTDPAVTAAAVQAVAALATTVVLDLGAASTVHARATVPLADEVLLVTTPDTLGLAAADRRARRLPRGAVRVLFNRVASRDRSTLGAAAALLDRPVVSTALPCTRGLVAAVRRGDPERAGRRFHRDLDAVAAELVPVDGPAGVGVSSESGALSVEAVVTTALVAAVGLALLQVLLAGWLGLVAGGAARAGARAAALGVTPGAVAAIVEAQLPALADDRTRVTASTSGRVEVAIDVPVRIAGAWTVRSHAVAPPEPAPLPRPEPGPTAVWLRGGVR